ncbi:MAG: NUDIX domain-containing protein [Candidatus Latescibacteria bacterium]|nr:NUDIX domain-containing protein [Candidatus Latescibacterota bacterium]
MRPQILQEVTQIAPYDELEKAHKLAAIDWIQSGAELFRTAKPATPPQHLVSYFVLTDGDFFLLVEHRNAGLWLPTGGHVEPDEHPRDAVVREAEEELAIEAQFIFDSPLFITVTQTVGRTAGHTDVSLWYVLSHPRTARLQFDADEFKSVRWFHKDRLPLEHCDPHMGRFAAKLAAARAR